MATMNSSTYAFLPSGLSFASCCLWAAVVILALAAYNTIYNLFLHPLHQHPGPLLWRTTRLPYALAIWNGTLPHKILAFHTRYGPIVRTAPDELAFISPSAWEPIQGLLQPGRRQNAKSKYSFAPINGSVDRHIIIAGDKAHARLRRLYAPAFTGKAVEEIAGVGGMVGKYADLLVSCLTKAVVERGREVQDLSDWYNFATFDLTGELAFGQSFRCLETGEYHFMVKTVTKGIVAAIRMMQLERWGIWSALQPAIPKSAFKAKADLDNYCAVLVDRRIEQGFVEGRVDVFNYLLSQPKGEDEPLTRLELVDNGVVLVVAGSETTATLLTGTTYLLAKNQEKLRAVTEEVRSGFKNSEEITLQSVNRLDYMLAVLSEAFRFFSPVPSGLARVVGTPGGQMIAGSHVPEGTSVAIFHWAAYHSAENFHQPDEFIPERWLKPTPAEFANDKFSVVQPFHVGPRSCIGKNLAYAESRILLCKMLFHFDIELAEPEHDWIGGLRIFSVWERTPMRVRLKPVQRA